jgi:hypothetical protein
MRRWPKARTRLATAITTRKNQPRLPVQRTDAAGAGTAATRFVTSTWLPPIRPRRPARFCLRHRRHLPRGRCCWKRGAVNWSAGSPDLLRQSPDLLRLSLDLLQPSLDLLQPSVDLLRLSLDLLRAPVHLIRTCVRTPPLSRRTGHLRRADHRRPLGRSRRT